MPDKTVFVAALLGSFLAGCVAPAGADDWDRNRSEHRMDTRRIESLSRRIERQVRQVRREAERRHGDRRHRGYAPLGALHRLEKRAEWFGHRVERRPVAIRRLHADFRALQERFWLTDARLRHAHARQLHRELRRVATLLAELERELYRSLRIAGARGPRHGGDRARDGRGHTLAWNW
jgi:hypothetical protein